MAELTLAAIPVAGMILRGCLDMYNLFTEAKELGNESQALIWKFRIQQTRLFGARNGGLLASSSHHAARTETDDEDNPLVLETLLRISDILKDYKQLKQRYGLSLVCDDPTYRQLVGDIISDRGV
jgi:hypothetical protein